MDTNKVPKAEETKKWKVWPKAPVHVHVPSICLHVFHRPCIFVSADLLCARKFLVCRGAGASELLLWMLLNISQGF